MPPSSLLRHAVGHPLIHLGYAYEISSRTLAIEALALICCSHDFMAKYLNYPNYTEEATPSLTSSSILDLLSKISQDHRFDIFADPGHGDLEALFEKREDAILEYWNAWTLTSPKTQFEESQKAAVALLVGTVEPGSKFDFFLVHLLTSSHAVRILLPTLPANLQIPLVRQWWLFTIAVYIAQARPEVDLERVTSVDLAGQDWKHVDHAALTGSYSLDAHYVKAMRAMQEAARTWGDPEQFFLKGAVRFADEFGGWGGFGTSSDPEA